ncbi:Cytochrome b5 [Ananas comosus]|uniref:Cytochrome b5 n=1 Tax=Ananas comosus TaxID=4615 RepID=A0A199V7T8_ANACO|nr:Cytochrome b5 [Ananas comosus]
MGEKVYTLEEVSKHNTNKDCWLVINGKVYDVTKFLEDHPGGDDVLISSTGKGCNGYFEDVGHSTTARAMMDEYYVGDIDTSTIRPSEVHASQTALLQPGQDLRLHHQAPPVLGPIGDLGLGRRS